MTLQTQEKTTSTATGYQLPVAARRAILARSGSTWHKQCRKIEAQRARFVALHGDPFGAISLNR